MTTQLASSVHAAVRQRAGWYEASDLALLTVRGPDAAAFLHSQTTNDVRALEPGKGHASAAVDAKAHVVAAFSLHRRGDEFLLLVDARRGAPLAAHLEKHHIMEDLEIAEGSGRHRFLAVEGPRAAGILARALPDVRWPVEEHGVADFPPGGPGAFAVWRSDTGEDGFLLAAQPDAFEPVRAAVLEAAGEDGLVEIAPEARETLRIEAGVPRWGADFDEERILPATGLEQRAVSYTKGCFIGQEVIARVKTYGAVSKALIGIVFEGVPAPPPPGTLFSIAGKEVGEVRSGCVSPTLGVPIALAYLLRDYREAGRRLDLEAAGSAWKARVVVPPFVERADRRERSARATERAQRDFAEGREDDAVRGLREAILLDPKNSEAYESLGVILSRHGQYEEAIVLMKELAQVKPDEPMAWTNMSLFWMKLGHKPEAEEAQGKAALLSMRAHAARARLDKDAAARRLAERQALERRLEMFREVLGLDADDHLANFGLGKGLLDLERAAEGLPYLEKANRVKPDHSVGHVELGRCLEALGRVAEAKDAYARGVAVATRRGDMMPLQEMQRRLAALGPSRGGDPAG